MHWDRKTKQWRPCIQDRFDFQILEWSCLPWRGICRNFGVATSVRRCTITGNAIASKGLMVGQALGVKEPILQRPFAWTAGKTLFGGLKVLRV
ncbi:MAG: hypothetical protein CMI18_06500 [Opitutaceae bacterium]|nr:hypothetical protein [Opitutaceae bacterium]